MTLEPGQSVKDWADHFKGQPLVIDFGGFVESRVIEAAKLADVTVVPLSYQSTADLMPAVKTITAALRHQEWVARAMWMPLVGPGLKWGRRSVTNPSRHRSPFVP